MEKKYGVWAVREPTSIFGAAKAWCKRNGVPLEFDTEAEAQAYAKELNDGVWTGNVHYYVREKDPEPILYVRAAAKSNYAGMVALLGTDDKVYLGKEENYVSEPGQPAYYKNYDGSLCHVSDRSDMFSFLHGEGWVHSQADMLKHGLTMAQYVEFAKLRGGVLKQFEVQREVQFAGQPFQPPENYLRNAELYEEGQTGNYNMITGLMDDKVSMVEEHREDEKQSVVARLKADRPEHEERQVTPSVPHRELS